jgi:hypothetical protein
MAHLDLSLEMLYKRPIFLLPPPNRLSARPLFYHTFLELKKCLSAIYIFQVKESYTHFFANLLATFMGFAILQSSVALPSGD